MKLLKRIWTGTSTAERLLLGVALLGVLSTCAFAAAAFVKRPGDISNPNADFRTGSLGKKPEELKQPQGEDRSVDWPRFGYDLARTKFLNAQKVRPPFRKLWKYDQDQLIEFPPIIAGERMYLIDNDGVFVTLNEDTGKVVWKKQLGQLNASSPVHWRGMLLAVNLEPPQALGVRAKDGKVLWERALPSRAESSPAVVGDRMYFGTESGEFFALEARTGKPIWSVQLDGSVKAAPAYADGTLYVGDYAGQMYAIRADDGAIRWQTGDLGTGLGSGRFYSTPAVAFGRVYAGNVDGRMYSFDRQSGEIAWTYSAGDFVYSGVAAADGKKIRPSVYFGSHDRNVYAVEADSGDLIWKAQPGGQISGPATVIGDVVYVSTFSGNSTLGFDLGTGRRVFKVDDGEYGPVVSDGERLFVTGGSTVIAYKPVKLEDFEEKAGEKGIVPPSERRRLRGKQTGGKGSSKFGGKKGGGKSGDTSKGGGKKGAKAPKGGGKPSGAKASKSGGETKQAKGGGEKPKRKAGAGEGSGAGGV